MNALVQAELPLCRKPHQANVSIEMIRAQKSKGQAFTGWRGITQYLAGIGNTTVMEQVIAERAAA